MSLILDALNRAENERKNQNLVPDLSTLHAAAEFKPAVNNRHKLWLIIILVITVVAMLVAIIVLLRRELVAPQPAVVNTPTALSVASLAAVQQSSVAAVPVVQEVAVTDQARALSSAPSMPAATADVQQLYAADAIPSPVADESVNELYAAELALNSESETIVNPFGGTATNSAQAVHTPALTFAAIKNVPDFNELPWNMRQKIPTITYQRHNYLADGISSVVINNQTSGIGNIIAVGQFVVQEIYVDGVILKHGNAVFKLRALNGWINM